MILTTSQSAATRHVDEVALSQQPTAVDAIPDGFRGPAIPRLAKRIARGTKLTAKDIGDAAASLHDCPDAWHDWGPPDETVQHIKQLWHVLVQFGQPMVTTSVESEAGR